MTSEIRTNSLTSRAGLSTVTLTDSGPMFSGITTFVDNSTFSVGTGGTIHAPATNTLNIGVNNTESLRIDSNSNLKVAGIVTATHFYGNGSNLSGISAGTSLSGSTNNTVCTVTGANAIQGEANLTYDGTTLKIGGDSGVTGTWGLEVYNTDTSNNLGKAVFAGNQGAEIKLQDTVSGETVRIAANGQASFYSEKAGDPMVFYTKPSGGSNTARLLIDSNGRLLVNTTTGFAGDNTMIIAGESPSGGTYDLYDGQLLITSTETSGAVNTGGVIQFYGHDGGSSRGFGSIRCLKENGTSGNHNAYMGFLLRVNGGNPTERLRISSNGDIGIGDNNPNIRLTVVDSGTENLVRLGRSDGNSHGSHTVNIKASKDFYHNFKMEASTYQLHCYDGSSMNERFRINSNGECFIGASYHGYTNRSTDLSVTGPYQNPAGVWTQVGVYSDDGQAADKGGTIGFGGQDGSTPQQQFAAIKGAKANGTSGNYEGYMSFFIRPNGAVSQERFRINANGTIAALAAGPSNFAGSSVQENYHQLVNSQAYTWITKMRNMTWGYGLRIDVADDTTREGFMLYSDKSGVNQAKASIIMDGTFRSRNNTYTSYSDIKLKENIVDAGSQWDDIKGLKVRNFNFKIDDPSQKMIGVIAQEAETVCPNLVRDVPDREDKDGQRVETGTHTKEVKYSILYMKAIKALQEAMTRIETLEQDNITLRARVTNLEGE